MSAAGRTLWNFFIAQNFATSFESVATIVKQKKLKPKQIFETIQTTRIQLVGIALLRLKKV